MCRRECLRLWWDEAGLHIMPLSGSRIVRWGCCWMDLFRGSSDRLWLWLRFQLVPVWYVLVPYNYGIGNRLLNRRDDKKKSVMGYELLPLC